MKRFRRGEALILAAALALGLAGCGSTEKGKSSASSSGSEKAEKDSEKNDGEIVSELLSGYSLPELSEEDKNYTVNLGYYNCDHMAAASLGEATGIFKALGITVKTTGNGNVPEAMSAGQMDMAYCGWTTTLSAVQKHVPLFIAAENHTGGSEYLVVSNKIEKPEELIGKKISVGTEPEKNNLNWAEWTKQLNIPEDITKYDNQEMSDSDEYLALVAGSLDGYICCDPWGSMAEYSKAGHVMVRQDTDRPSGHGTCCKVAMNYTFSKAHPELAKRMLLAHTLCIQYMYEHPYRAARIFSAYYNVPVEVALMTYWRKLVDEGRTIRWDLNLDYMRNQLATMREYGIRDDINTVNVEDYVDLSYFDQCGAKNFEDFAKEKVDPVFPEGMSYEDFKKKALAIDHAEGADLSVYEERKI